MSLEVQQKMRKSAKLVRKLITKFRKRRTRRLLKRRLKNWPQVKKQFDQELESLDATSVCLDLGANIGVFTQQMAETGAKVFAFEPDPHAFSILSERLKKYPNAILTNAAVAQHSGSLRLIRPERFDENPTNFTVGTGAFYSTLNGKGGEAIDVDCCSFKDIVENIDVPIDVIKMDIEGCEVAILEEIISTPLLGAAIKSMFVETHEAQMPELRSRTAAIRRSLGKNPKFNWICLDWR